MACVGMSQMTVPSPLPQEEEEFSSKLLLSRHARTLPSHLVLDLKDSAFMKEEMQQESSKEDEPESPPSPLCSSLRAIRRARAFAGPRAAMLASAEAKTWLLHHGGKEQHENSGPAGFSQSALDQLTGAVENGSSDDKEFETDDENSEENCLLRQKRHRAFPDLPTTWISKMPSRGEDSVKCSGLSQADLDDNCVHEPASEASTDCTEISEVLWEQESALLCIKRLKAFGGVGEACAMSEQMRDTKFDSDNRRGLSQADLDDLGVQESMDGVTPRAMCSLGQDLGETSPMGQEGMLLRARRMRAFLGSKTAASFAERALAETTDCNPGLSRTVDASATCSALCSRRGKSQLELDMLCVEGTEEGEKSKGSPSPASRVASPQRKRSPTKASGSSPERGGA
eukprot:TRINITY_DN43637_c0_g1_i1.p1 TRINITY_DN43637_c0_g1~~TRINITY_DN43637_c0_g1_i1.p1  ORF type:complete len:399 (+),score=81.15 TRINITY_DN43637_c0_g1_i1:62-1258(+)